jgi:hypothetical protein
MSKRFLVASGTIALLVGVIAIISPPNMWDAMEYHLPRAVMWMSNHTVRFYATPDYAQLIFGPWAEFAMMHTLLLWGSDRFVNFIQFFSFIGSLVGISLIAEKLGAGARGQALAVVVCATIPEGILEASGSMNTFVVTFWIVTTVAFLLVWNEDPSWLNTCCLGLSAGIAILTKGTAFIYLPFMVLVCWWMASPKARLTFLKRSAFLLLLIVAVNGPMFFRCYQFTGSPLGLPFKDGGPRLHWMVDRITLRGAFANVLRNVSLHLSTPLSSVNAHILGLFRAMIRAIGVNPDDPATVWAGDNFHMNRFSLSEIHAGNPLHLCLLVLAIGTVLFYWHRPNAPLKAPRYALGIIAGFLFFCTLLRWQMWASRHHLPLFVLGSALIGLFLERYIPKRIATVAVSALLIYSVPFVLSNRTRSFVPWRLVDDVYQSRSVMYFSDQHEALASANMAAAEAVNRLNCNDIAIDSYTPLAASEIYGSPRSFYVYPLLAMIHADGGHRTVWYQGVHNWSNGYEEYERHPTPCAVICLDCARVPQKWAEYRGIGGRASAFDYIVVFSASGQAPNPVAQRRERQPIAQAGDGS